MVSGASAGPGLLLAAQHLEWWADNLSLRSHDGREPWHAFLERRYEAEVALIEGLRRSPNSRIVTCPSRMRVSLALGGLVVSTEEGLEVALRAWAAKARGQTSAESAPQPEP